ncbi:MAG: SUMF1/EgtB/PvdO family nonheme iron enzyme [Oscillatoria princeps RMCB-10]|jgi:formylglycine-generating enzyme required for sulfatase activity|nr:SUMF1/EgtB/PvdO family nonheme iron enzyme [Oscillatoria princeps RMCB-10]
MKYWRGLIACGTIALSVTGCWGEKSPDEIRAALEKGVVLISYGDKGGHGTGFVVGRNKGVCTALTAAHVSNASQQLLVQTYDKKLWKRVEGKPLPGLDLAEVRFEVEAGDCPYPALVLGNSDKLKSGDRVRIFGYPQRLGTSVLVAQFPGGEVTAVENPPLPEGYAISYDASTYGGMSGGPVVNAAGEVVAVHGMADLSKLSPQQKADVEGRLGENFLTFRWGIPINAYLARFPDVRVRSAGVLELPVSAEWLIAGGIAGGLLLGARLFGFRSSPSSGNYSSPKGVSAPQPPKPSSQGGGVRGLPFSSFAFDAITVDAQGRETNRSRRQAEYFPEDLGGGLMLEMVSIPGGTFGMGSPNSEKERYDRESPQHWVTVQPFFMGKYAVTQAQWKVVAALPKVNLDLNPDPSRFKGANRPVENVSWDDAMEFCARLSKKTGRDYRLPSEAEWEYACRAGTTTPFHFGETFTTDLANYNGNYTYASGPKGKYRQETTPVGSFPPNAFGLYDMHGNVWEWCADPWHDNYAGAPSDGSVWNSGGNKDRRMRRGGSWVGDPRHCPAANRDGYEPEIRNGYIGFRAVVSLLRT